MISSLLAIPSGLSSLTPSNSSPSGLSGHGSQHARYSPGEIPHTGAPVASEPRPVHPATKDLAELPGVEAHIGSITAIILWNTRYLEHAVAALRQAENVPDQLLANLSPLGWEHVNLTGDYIWSAERPVTESRDGVPPAQGWARYRSQGRLSSWFVRLCVKSGRFVTSGHDRTRRSRARRAGRCPA